MKSIILILTILFFSCNENKVDSTESIHSFIDNEIEGDVRIEILKKEKPSIFIEADILHQYNDKCPHIPRNRKKEKQDNGCTILFGAVSADLYNDDGNKASVVYSDSAIIFNESDSVKAIGDVLIKSVKGYELKTDEIVLYNDLKLVKSDDDVSFTSNNDDWLYGKGFWSNFDMTNFEILKPKGELGRLK
tara:strand:- start:199 stop:768 length:570 start_codon:yes stop_codon:yes gene_type:complete